MHRSVPLSPVIGTLAATPGGPGCTFRVRGIGPVGFVVCAAFLAGLLPASPCRAASQVTAHVERRGETIVVDIETTFPGTVKEAWDVLTDYAGMASFVANIKSSTVVSRRGNSLVVRQSGETAVGFLHFGFAAVRSVTLTPMKEIDSMLLSGDFKSYVSTTRLVEERSGVRIAYHGEYVPKSWIPPIIGPAVIESQSRKQYGQYIDEMRRRQSTSTGVR